MKQESKRHHYTPEFYLSRWTAADGRLCIIRNFNGEIQKTRRPPSQTGFEFHLYSYTEGFSAADRAEIETTFFKPLDNEGAKIITKIINNERLDHQERTLWAQFLCAMRIRTPENVEKIKHHAIEYMIREFESDQEKYDAHKSPEDPERFIDWVEMQNPGLIENVGIAQIPKISASPQALTAILRMNWYIVDFKHSSHPLVTSDRPFIATMGLQKPNCIIALPLSPRYAFFAFYPNSKAQNLLMKTPITRLAAALNENVVTQAKERAYSQNIWDAADSFYQERLAKTTYD